MMKKFLEKNGASQLCLIFLNRWIHKIYFIVLFSVSFVSNSQKVADSTKLFKEKLSFCDNLYKSKKIDKSIDCYKNLSISNSSEVGALLKLVRIYYSKKEFPNAIKFAFEAIDKNANESSIRLVETAMQMQKDKNDYLALKIINKLSASSLDSHNNILVQRFKEKFTLKLEEKNVFRSGVSFENIGEQINSSYNEYLPSLSLDGNNLIFTRNVGGNEDFFESKKDSLGKWRKAVNMGYPPNTGLPDGAAKLSADGNYLFYTRCDRQSPNGYEGGGCDLVFSYRVDSAWSAPQYFGLTINTPGFEGQPCLSSDNVDMYFVSDREGGFGGKDIWVSHFVNNFWSKPENLGPLINTTADETAPFIHPDNVSLYFSSNGHVGLGSNDLFFSKKNQEGAWTQPINLGAPINSEKFDGSIVVNAKGSKGYCASERADSKGGLDIYSFDMHPAIMPIPTVCLKGFVKDKFTKNNIQNADLFFYELATKTPIGELVSNKGDASFAKALHLGKNYLVKATKTGYRPFYKTIHLKIDTVSENIFFNLRLKKPELLDTLFSTTISVDSTKEKFTEKSYLILDSIIQNWKQWNEDSAEVKILFRVNYYAGDSLADSNYLVRLTQSIKQLNMATDYFTKKGINCSLFLDNLNMLVLKDEEELFDNVYIEVIEYY